MGNNIKLINNMSDEEVKRIEELLTNKKLYKHFSDEAFDQLDADKSGFLEPSEIKQVLEQFGAAPSDENVKDVMKDLDTDNNGKIDQSEFAELFKKVLGMMLEEMKG